MHGQVMTGLLLACAMAAPAQESARTTPPVGAAAAARPAIRHDATTLVVPAGRHAIGALVDAVATFLGANVLADHEQLGRLEPVVVQTGVLLDRDGAEELLSEVLFARGCLLVPPQRATAAAAVARVATYLVVAHDPVAPRHVYGQQAAQPSEHARLRTVDEVLARPSLKQLVAVRVPVANLTAEAAAAALQGLLPYHRNCAAVQGVASGRCVNLCGLQSQLAPLVEVLLAMDREAAAAPLPAAEPEELRALREAIEAIRVDHDELRRRLRGVG